MLPGLAAQMAREIRGRTVGGRDADGRPLKRHPTGRPANLKRTGKTVASFGPQRITPTGFTLAPDPNSLW